MSHVFQKIKGSTKIDNRKHGGMHDSHFLENMTKQETTIFETDAHR